MSVFVRVWFQKYLEMTYKKVSSGGEYIGVGECKIFVLERSSRRMILGGREAWDDAVIIEHFLCVNKAGGRLLRQYDWHHAPP